MLTPDAAVGLALDVAREALQAKGMPIGAVIISGEEARRRAIGRMGRDEARGALRLEGFGTAVRSYDPAIDAWRSAFLIPGWPSYCSLIGRAGGGDRVIQNGHSSDGNPIRCTFNDIKQDSFVWSREPSYDAQKTWRLEQEMTVGGDDHHARVRRSVSGCARYAG